jgi:hypothetical protein
VSTIREEITKFSVKYTDKITIYPNELTSTLLEEEKPRSLNGFKQTNLTTIFINNISEICEYLIGEYLLGYYSA